MYYKKRLLSFLVCAIVFCSYTWSQTNIPPTITATGNQVYCPLSQINVVTAFDIIDPDDTEVDALFVQISTGYVAGEDTLTLTGTHSNIVSTWNALEGKLALEGVSSALVSYTDLIAAVHDVVFESTNNAPINKFFSFTIGDANFLPSTGHFYEYVPALGITWTDARTAAEARSYFGLQGYLATITSQDEAQLSGEQAAGAGWIGGSDAATEGVWQWVTGPESGTVFWNGGINGATPNYANWNDNEPNNAGDEDYAHVTAPGVGVPGSWNDLTNTGKDSGDFQPKGYIVEYGGLPGDPILNISASTSIYTISITDTEPNSICGSGAITLEATASQGDVLWFDAINTTTPIFTGEVFTPTINATTTYYALASVNGCVEGVRVPVVATVRDIPTINSISEDALICESTSVTLSATASAGIVNWYDVASGGTPINTGPSFITPVLNATTTYYVDATLNGCTTTTRSEITLTLQITPTPVGNATQSFCDIENAELSNIAITGNSIQWYASATGGNALDETTTLVNNTTYYASQTINNCESVVRLPVTVEVYETVVVPQPSEIPDLYACDTSMDGDDANGYTTFDLTANEMLLLNGKSALDYTFQYFIDASYSVPIATPETAFINTEIDGQTIYVRIVNNIRNTCYTDASFNIEVNELPVIDTLMTFKNCDQDGVSDGFTDFNLNELDAIIINDDAEDLVITYYDDFNDAVQGNNEISSIVNNQNFSTVYVRVENSNGCYKIANVSLEVSTTSFPNGYIEELDVCDEDDTIDGLYVFDLTEASSLFIAQFPLGQNLSVHYFETLNDAQLEQNEILNQDNYINKEAFYQELYVRVESDDNGACFGLGQHLNLIVHPRPEFEVDQSEVFCFDTNSITISTYNPSGDYTYEWKDENDIIISELDSAVIEESGTYTVIARSNEGCESFPVELAVVESARAVIGIDDVTIVEFTDNNSITINNDAGNLGIGDYEFALGDETGPTIDYQDEPFFDGLSGGSHFIYVSDKNKCGISDPLEVFILGFPKFFTPNNDGTNDTWEIKGLGVDYTNASVVSVFDRYGKLIKHITATSGAWDGTFHGDILPPSDYWFIAKLIENDGTKRSYKGHFSLIR